MVTAKQLSAIVAIVVAVVVFNLFLTIPIQTDDNQLYAPYTCPSYDRYLSHLSTKTPYSFRHPAFDYPACQTDTNNQQHNTPCIGPTCPIQLSPVRSSAMSGTEPDLVCKLKHISHLNRHGTRNPTKAGQIDKIAALFKFAKDRNGLIQQAPGGSESQIDVLSWIDAAKDMDPTFLPENGGHVSDLGRIELFGIGRRLRQRMDLTNFNPQDFFGSVTFKKRTLQSLLALLTGLGLYDIEGVRTGGRMKQMVSDSLSITIDGKRYAEPHVRVLMPQDLVDKVKHLIRVDLDNDEKFKPERDTKPLLEFLHHFEKKFVSEIIKRYPVHKHQCNQPLLVKLISFGQSTQQQIPNIFHLTIPPTGEGHSPIVELANDHGHNHPLADACRGHDHNLGVFNTFEDYEKAPIELFESSPLFAQQWKNAVLRSFDVCGQYDHQTTKAPKSWENWASRYVAEVCGTGTHCDLALHRVFTEEFIRLQILAKARNKAFGEGISAFYKNYTTGTENKQDIDMESFLTAVRAEIKSDFAHLYPESTSEAESKQMIDDLMTWIESKVSISLKQKTEKVKTDKTKKKNKNKGGKWGKTDDLFPTNFIPTHNALSHLYGVIINNLFPQLGAGDKFISKASFTQQLEFDDAKAKASIIKQIYSLCSLQLSVYSPTSTPRHPSNKSLVSTLPYTNQFCQVLGESNYDQIATLIQQYKQSDSFNQPDFEIFMSQLYHRLSLPVHDSDPHHLATAQTNLLLSEFRPDHPLPQNGSNIYFQQEYLTDIAQLAKKGAFESITLGAACPLLETILPELTPGPDQQQSMSVYGAHAETLLPLVALITGAPQLQTAQPPIPPPHTTKLDDPEYLNRPDNIYRLDDSNNEGPSTTSSRFLDGLTMMKQKKFSPDRAEKEATDDDIRIMVNPAWRASFHTPMAANLAVHVYECQPRTAPSDTPTALYAQLLLNEEPIQWHDIDNGAYKTGEIPLYKPPDHLKQLQNDTNSTAHTPQSTRFFLDWLVDYRKIKDYFKTRYEELGFGSCNIKDWNTACYVEGFSANGNAADDD